MDKKINKEAYTFSDVLIVPKYSEIESRRSVDLSSDFGFFKINLPIIAANMKTICGVKMSIAMIENGGMGILHRFCSIEQAVEDFLEVKNHFSVNEGLISNTISLGNSTVILKDEDKYSESCSSFNSSTFNIHPNIKSICNKDHEIGVSIGVQDEDKKRFDSLYEAGAKIFCIDIAHGHSLVMKNILKWIKEKGLKDIYIIAGNVSTPEGAYDIAEWGADCIKCGVGPGSACLTRKNTGVGVPQLYALESINEEFIRQGIKHIKIIADGGMSSIGDIAKSLKYSHAVMLGSMLSGSTETPGNVFTGERGEFYKVYAGSASGENKVSNGNANEFVEGVAKMAPFRGHVKHILKHIKHGLQSSFSYVGAKNLKEFQEKCEFIEITSGGKIESKL